MGIESVFLFVVEWGQQMLAPSNIYSLWQYLAADHNYYNSSVPVEISSVHTCRSASHLKACCHSTVGVLSSVPRQTTTNAVATNKVWTELINFFINCYPSLPLFHHPPHPLSDSSVSLFTVANKAGESNPRPLNRLARESCTLTVNRPTAQLNRRTCYIFV